MDILRVFFWFCKEQKIMDILYKIYQFKKLGTWKYVNNCAYFEPLSLGDFLSQRVMSHGFKDIFWDIQPRFEKMNELKENRYKKARSKWNSFVRNNLMYSEDFIKVGDNVELNNSWGNMIVGIVAEIPKEITKPLLIKTETHDNLQRIMITNYQHIKVNGEEREPKYCIKRRRKIYGSSKG